MRIAGTLPKPQQKEKKVDP